MRVEQQNTNIVDVLKQSVGPEETGHAAYSQKVAVFFEKRVQGEGKADASRSVNVKDATYLKPDGKEKQTIAEEIEQDSVLDASDRKEQMAVLAGTTTPEDYARMQEEGFSLDETVSNTIVTEVDKIKAQLAKAGVDISYFGDDLDLEDLEAIVGSAELAMQLLQAFKEADLPCTEENIREAADALKLAGTLQQPGDDAIRYLVENSMKPTIENLYKAEYSGNYQTGINEAIDINPFMAQLEQVIREAGLTLNEQTLADSQWMIENEIPFNAENLRYVSALREMAVPIDEEALLSAICTAVSEGSRPEEALLLADYTLQAQAEDAFAVVSEVTDEDLTYLIDNRMDLTVRNLAYAIANRGQGTTDAAADVTGTVESGTTSGAERVAQPQYTRDELALLTARRQLEEVRLMMSVEANYALLKRGIQIDTVSLEKLVNELKEEENAYYANLLKGQGAEAAEENIQIFRKTTEKLEELRYVPAYVLGRNDMDIATVEAVHASGKEMQESFQQANERYETLMTMPRADLGDSIQKAFQNVDDILRDLGLETTETNQRAVRILAYNQIAIDPEAIARIKAADEEVQRTFRNMTPATVTEMIKRGINPLDMDFASLNQLTEQIARETGAENEGIGEFLWKLEKNGAISEEERASYIGIYRLMHQVDHSDGAAIGALVNQGADVTMRNLMMAVRSERRSGKMDYAVDSSFEAGEGDGYKGTSIINQIEAGYQHNCMKDAADAVTPGKLKYVMEQTPDWMDMTPEQFKEALIQAEGNDAELDQAYAKEQLDRLSQSAKAAQDIYAVLEKYDIPNTVANVLALDAMAKDRNGMFRKLFGEDSTKEGASADELAAQKESVLTEYEEAIFSPEALNAAQQKLEELTKKIVDDTLESDTVSSIDVRELRMLGHQISIGSMLAKDEQYSVPVRVGDEIVNVSLKIVRGTDKKGMVDITMEDERYGKIAATFQAKEQGVTGLVVVDNPETKTLLEEQGLADRLAEDGEKPGDVNTQVHVAYIDDLDMNHFSMGLFGIAAEDQPGTEQTGKDQIQTASLYRIAERFIQQLREAL